jgi:KDO2-lipid IV(A) lauroyltransferase
MRARLFLPDYWPSWIAVGCLRIIASLPDSMIVRVGHGIGWLARRLPLRYSLIARRNIELCLPKLSSAEREQLIERHFQSLGMCLCEAAMCWWSSDERIRKLSQVEGVEHLQAALAAGHGALLLTAHFTTLEIGARILNATLPINVLYRPPGNEVLAAIAHRRRHGQARRAIRRDDVRAMVRALRDNEVVWYAPDQSYRKKGARMVNFFGIPAATNTFTPRLAQMTGAAVLFFSHERLPSGMGWKIVIHPALKDFPSGDEIADTERYHAFIESEVRRIPEQYWWIHRRFKGLTADYPNYYAKKAPVVTQPAIHTDPI